MDLYQQIFFTTLALSFAVVHFLLYFYNRKLKSNLFFAIFLLIYAANIFFDYQASLADNWESGLLYLRIHRAVVVFNPVFVLFFLYSAFGFNIPRYFWLIFSALLITGVFSVIDPVNNFKFTQYPAIIASLEAVRVFIRALIIKRYQAWILATGFALLFLFSSYDMLMDLNIISPVAGIVNGYPFGFLCLIIFSSIFLARDFANTNNILLAKEHEARDMEISRRLLEAEDRRKAAELNEARDLQVSLLPQCVSRIQNYDICFDMRTASEVGGDYYDYNISEDGTISIVIGDATDHGLKAGMMVSIIKSLFLTHVNNLALTDFLNNCSRTIKQMKLKNLYMALMLIKIKDNKLEASSAGIPPLLIYRKAKNTIEEHKLKGMPLGAVDSFPYQTIRTELEDGDIVLLMSDGLPELFNKDRESFGYEKLKELFLNYAEDSVNDIVGRLLQDGENWISDFKQNDDITLAAIRRTDAAS